MVSGVALSNYIHVLPSHLSLQHVLCLRACPSRNVLVYLGHVSLFLSSRSTNAHAAVQPGRIPPPLRHLSHPLPPQPPHPLTHQPPPAPPNVTSLPSPHPHRPLT